MTRLGGAIFSGANLCGVRFIGVDLEGTNLEQADLTGAKFSENGKGAAINLTQRQLDRAVADPDNPPDLSGVIDPDSGREVVWNGKAKRQP